MTVDGFALWAVGDFAHDPHAMALDIADTAQAEEAAWTTVATFNGTNGTAARQEFGFGQRVSRFWRWRILNTCCGLPTWQSFVREVEFKASAPLPEAGPGGSWRHKHGLTPHSAAAAAALPRVRVSNFSARSEWDRFTDMERMASPAEVSRTIIAGVGVAFFQEDQR